MTGRWGDDDSDDAAPRSIWDDADDDHGDLLDPLRLVDPAELWGTAPQSPDAAAGSWREAAVCLALPLAEAAAAQARVDERVRAWPPEQARAGVQRLALAQAAALLWAEGAPVTAEHLALDGALRAGRTGQADHEIARAVWAARRLAAQRWSLASPAAVMRFEGRVPVSAAEPASDAWGAFARARGVGWDAAVQDWAAAVRALRDTHPLAQAAFAETAWRQSGLSEAGAVVEPSVVAMKIAARGARGGVPFVPLARRRTPAQGDPAARLRGFYADVARGCEDALVTLSRLQDWRSRAEAGVADLSGRTPGRLVALLAGRIAVSAQDAAQAGDVSVSAAQRNLVLLSERGLAREITGQGRYRLWTAAL